MPQTVEAFYHDGIVELKEKPAGILSARALVVFPDAGEAPKRHTVDTGTVSSKKSSVDKWIGVIEGADLGDWKVERRAAIEGNLRESSATIRDRAPILFKIIDEVMCGNGN